MIFQIFDFWLILGIASISIAGAANAVMDTLVHHYDQSIFPKMGKAVWFWNPKVSWQRKWKDGKKENGEAFPLSSTALVFLTDGWHLFQFIQNRFYNIAFGAFAISGVLNPYEGPVWVLFVFIFVMAAVVHSVSFEVFYGKILIKND